MSLACGMRAVQFVFFLAIFSRHPGGVRVILKEAKAQKWIRYIQVAVNAGDPPYVL